ncbi:hypothetical protein GCG54_00004357 [Colletotrichum gloeosporioides]|uniref:Uncharacterized protein n=1 Tax=Colletotrichum gloeosporioides TaxID=474922 RepID=A0A8H4CLL4_COLGL|nr:uncharacterized protein GCG54_00004357 [Colletotrichum gloeosporioides]KAF3806032.1 hypothetical protein GCG54_00004357 [Colletotrichum gloeosporioides]
MAKATGTPPSSISTIFRKLPYELTLMIADELISATTSNLQPHHFEFYSHAQTLQVVRRVFCRRWGDSEALAKERYIEIRTILQINQRIRRAARKAYLPLAENNQKEWVCLERDVFVLDKHMLQPAETFQHLTPHNLHILQNLRNIVIAPYDAHFLRIGVGSRGLRLMGSVTSIGLINAAFEGLADARERRLEDGNPLGLVPLSQVIQDAHPSVSGIPSLRELDTSLSHVLGRLKSKNVRIFIQLWCHDIFEQRNKENSFDIISCPDEIKVWLS